jgi:hypothetical protein
MPSLPSNCEHIRLLRRAIDRVLEPRISCDQWRSSLAWARGGQSSIDGGGYSYISQRPCRRLVRRLQKLANQFGRLAGHLIEIDAYRTQERISQTMTASRERVSAGLHLLRKRGMIQYSPSGHLLLDMKVLIERQG